MKINVPKSLIKTEKITIETCSFEVGYPTLLSMLQAAGLVPDAKEAQNVKSINIYIRVPGGGDWSNTNLDLQEHNIQVKFVKETKVTT